MAILQVVTDVTGLIGVQPQNIYIKTTDTLAEVMTPGYLNQVKQQGYQLSNWQIAEVYGVDFNNGQPGSLLFQVQTPANPSTGNYTLVSMAAAGEVVLPVTAGHLASFVNSSGAIQDSNAEFVGGHAFVGTLTGDTAVTFPTSGTLATTASIPTFPVSPTNGGTGVSNTGTITVGGNTAFSGAHNFTGTLTADTSVTFPTSGTLATTGAIPSFPLSPANGGTGENNGSFTLTVNANSIINQDVSTAGSPSFVNVHAGSSGVQGSFSSYPTTANKGLLAVEAVNNTGNFFTIISNAAMGQNTVVSIPNPAASTANFTLAPSALVSGNLVKASGTAGLLVDAGVAPGSIVESVTGTAGIITSTGGQNPVINIDPAYIGQTSITTLGSITTGVWNGTTVAINYGGTGVTSVTTAPAATAFAGWNANKNLSANAFIGALTDTAVTGGLTTLTVASNQYQLFTGTNSQSLQLPATSTLATGQSFYVFNQATQPVSVQTNSSAQLPELNNGSSAIFTCVSTASDNVSAWQVSFFGGDSAIVANNFSTAVALAASDIDSMYATPFQVFANTDPSSVVFIEKCILDVDYISGVYAGGGDVQLQYGNTAHGAGPVASTSVPASAFYAISENCTMRLEGYQLNPLNNSAAIGQDIYISNTGAAFNTGISSMTVYIWYTQFEV